MVTDYDSLLSRLAEWLVRSAVDISPSQLIQLAHDDLASDWRVQRIKRGTLSISAGDATVAMPDDFGQVVSWALDAPYDVQLQAEAPVVSTPPADATYRATPTFYHIVGGTAYLRPTPSQDFGSHIIYKETLPRLTEGSDTNWLIDDFPTVYWWACLEQAMPYAMNMSPQMAALFGARKDALLDKIKARNERAAYGGAIHERLTLGGAQRGF